jgi:hypothetical protein
MKKPINLNTELYDKLHKISYIRVYDIVSDKVMYHLYDTLENKIWSCLDRFLQLRLLSRVNSDVILINIEREKDNN